MDCIESNGCARHANSENANGTTLNMTIASATLPEKLPSGKSGLKSTAKAENANAQVRFLARDAWKATSRAAKLTMKRSGSSYLETQRQFVPRGITPKRCGQYQSSN